MYCPAPQALGDEGEIGERWSWGLRPGGWSIGVLWGFMGYWSCGSDASQVSTVVDII